MILLEPMCSLYCHAHFSLTFLSQALALLGEYIDNEDSSVRIGAIMGLGIAYAGSQNDQVKISHLITYSVRLKVLLTRQ